MASIPTRHRSGAMAALAALAAAGLLAASCGGGGRGVRAATSVTPTTPPPTTPPPTPTPTTPTPTTSAVAPVPSTTAKPVPTTAGRPGATNPASQTVTATSGALTVTLTVTPVRAGTTNQPIAFHLQAHGGPATGAVAYVLTYGDGTTDQNVVAQYCRGSGGAPVDESWSLSHAYAAPGTYQATARASVNCGGPSASTAPVTVTVS